MYYSYVEIEYVATSFSPTRTDLALKLSRNNSDCKDVDLYNTRKRYASHFENYFPPQPINWHNCTTVLYTKYVRNTKNYFRPEPKN
jgi:hypothetical protein